MAPERVEQNSGSPPRRDCRDSVSWPANSLTAEAADSRSVQDWTEGSPRLARLLDNVLAVPRVGAIHPTAHRRNVGTNLLGQQIDLP